MKIKYKFRFLILTFVGFIAVSSVITFFGIQILLNNSIQVFSERGISVVNRARGWVDPEEFQRLAKYGDENDPYYDFLYKKFFEIKKDQGCKYLYTMVPLHDKVFKYVVDGSALPFNEEDFSPYGTEEDISSYGKYPFECLEKQDTVTSRLVKQKDWGWTISVYAPIIFQNQAIGFVACDYDVSQLIKTIKKNCVLLLTASFISAIVISLFLLIYISSFFKKVDGVTQAMIGISSGARDLTQRLPIKGKTELDMLSFAYNEMIEQLQAMVRQISVNVSTLSKNSITLAEQNKENLSSIENVKHSIEEIYVKADDQNALSEAVSDGVTGVENAVKVLDDKIVQTSDAIEQSSSAIEEISANIAQADTNIEQIAGEYSKIVVEAENGVKKQNDVTSHVDHIVQQAKRLAETNNVISNIAAQTNLLAMNAAIEAAHAGSSGKGFSVVADEIRKLAENSAKQSTSVENLISEITQSIGDIVDVSKGSAQSFSSLGTKIKDMDVLLKEVKVGMSEQNKAAQDILQMMAVLANAANQIKDASDVMKNNTTAVANQMSELKDSSREILESGTSANVRLEQMTDFASKISSQSEENNDLADRVNSLVSSYQV
ncbi:MAG: HAMP domain-containing protein [Treponema sp.]|nr:HAMP domain-containing protein [Candidatus Treponema merdequi]